MLFQNTLQFARAMDRRDPLRSFRKRFHIPRKDGKPGIYFAGNSLGLQPKAVKEEILAELEDWARLGVEGHVHARRPWMYYHKFSKKALARITGAKPSEVVAMNHLTVNLHLLMVSFFRPDRKRYAIMAEAGAFPSDQYALESQLKFHGIEPDEGLIELKPRAGEYCLRTEDIILQIEENRHRLALVLFGGVQYYTGQRFDLRGIAKAGHDAGAVVGVDLAHAIGNVPLKLHDDGIDFAVWCSYKYLNSGPGAVAGAFIHERHGRDIGLPRFAGWWGHDEHERFLMKQGFKPMPGADGWQLSNHPVLPAAAHLAALSVFEDAGMSNIRRKSELLTGYLEFILNRIDPGQRKFRIITPADPKQRGCQLSILMKENGKRIFSRIVKAGVIADWREPGVIRVAPVPLYNTFEEVFQFGRIFQEAIGE